MPCGRAETENRRRPCQHPGINGRCQEICVIQCSIHSAPSPEKLLRKPLCAMPLRDPHNPALQCVSINHQSPYFPDSALLICRSSPITVIMPVPVKKIYLFFVETVDILHNAMVMRSRPSMVTLLQGLDSRSSRKFHPVFIIFLIFPNNMSICKEMRNILAFHFLFI